ncbi:MAG: DNA topoisomerase I, partial [Candidatus Marinimicrobia bacterium]|nr:DNA topoisomerase I [Candidatus Neomarinimicrobiota bacterium]
MSKNLLIVESPSKARTIKKYLGRDFQILASVGHIRDLPVKEIGVDIQRNFKPKYVTIKGKTRIIQQLRTAAKNASSVYLATDPDREGEAIAWHIASVLKVSN